MREVCELRERSTVRGSARARTRCRPASSLILSLNLVSSFDARRPEVRAWYSRTSRTRSDAKATEIIEHPNKVLTNELTSINQYFLHSRMFENWGLKRLAEHEHHESIDG
jgi:hypothetical protein